MDIFRLLFLACIICSAYQEVVGQQEGEGLDDDLADFPLDDPGGSTDRVDIGDKGQELNELEDIDLTELQATEGSRQELLRKVMAAAMSKPGARQRLAQVMPILRTMSATQRLALAGLVTSQLMAPPGSPPPPPVVNSTNSNMTDDLMIPISMDIAAMFRGLGRDATAARSNLFRGDLYNRHPPYRRRPEQTLNRRNNEVQNDDMKPPLPPMPPRSKFGRRPGGSKLQVGRPPPQPALHSNLEAGSECQLFSDSLCLQVNDYPMEAILKSIQNTPNKNAFEALRLDAKQDFGGTFGQEVPKMERRQGQQEPQSLCSSTVEIARPKRARATSGQWKYVVNTGDYTQTLRLEMCNKPQQSCSYLGSNLKSECTQVYNYHRLLTWDQKSGLTMDIFKVPTCCSCHILGMTHPFLGVQRPQASEVEPQRHPGPSPPPRVNYVEAPETNFVAAEDTQAVHRLPPPKQIFNRRPGLHNIPKRESLSPRPLPPRGPPQVLAEPPGENIRYPVAHPPYENLLRRTISRNNTEQNEIRPKYHPVQPTLNQRHPELPVDSLLADNTFSYVTSAPDYQPPPRTYQTSTPKRVPVSYPSTVMPPPLTTRRMVSTTPQTQGSSKRVNYSYHPIIDFFKTSVSANTGVVQEGMNNAEWTPITDGPRLMPK